MSSNLTITTASTSSCGDPVNANVVWTSNSSTANPTWIGTGGTYGGGYTITTTGSTSGYVYAAPVPVKTVCRFCDEEFEMGLAIQNKKGEKHHVCVKCLKELMVSEKIKELMDLIEPLATMAELAKT